MVLGCMEEILPYLDGYASSQVCQHLTPRGGTELEVQPLCEGYNSAYHGNVLPETRADDGERMSARRMNGSMNASHALHARRMNGEDCVHYSEGAGACK